MIDTVKEKVQESKSTQTKAIEDARKKRLNVQQRLLLPEFVSDPELLVGKTVSHKCREEGEKDITWYPAKVVKISDHQNGIKTEFDIEYLDVPGEIWHFPLLKDLEKGGVGSV